FPEKSETFASSLFKPPGPGELPTAGGAGNCTHKKLSKNIETLGKQHELPPALKGVAGAVNKHGPNVSSDLIRSLHRLGVDPSKVEMQNFSKLIIALCKRARLE